MYWYNPANKKIPFFITGFILLLGIAACKRDSAASADTMKFFDIKGFFRADSLRLTKLNPLVEKTVTHDKVAETRKVHIENWGNELSLFIGSDINKPAWKDSYNITTDNGLLVYRANDPSLKTTEVVIKKDGDRVKWILIYNHTKNILYQTDEKLSYFPDSLYLIQKVQWVKLLGRESYGIRGTLINDARSK
ncbi:MAG TPA: hypothetical protein VGM63_16700 [Mucilaginibacter sp.]|jgi:hypothetical protein